MTTNLVSRRAALTVLSWCVPCASALLAACGGETAPTGFAPLNWAYLPPLKLNVDRIDVDDSWTPRAGVREKGFLAPIQPMEALRKMAEDRLIPGGTSGQGVFVIDDASIRQSGEYFEGSFAVHLDIITSDGIRGGFAEARVSRRRMINDDSPNGLRAGLYDLVRQMMADMNVEFEYQVRRSLRDYLQTTAPAAPEAGPVEQQELAPPATDMAPPSLPPAEPGSEPEPAEPQFPSAVPFSSPAPTQLMR